MENGEPVITLKTPPDENRIRGEWELRGTGLLENGEILPSAFQALFVQGAPQRILDLQECGLETLCRVDFLRRRVSLCLEGGAVAELALDLGTLYRGHRSAPLCEIELEGKGGSFAPVEALAQELMRRYPLQEEPLSKFQQTMQL